MSNKYIFVSGPSQDLGFPMSFYEKIFSSAMINNSDMSWSFLTFNELG
jgi:hypothetical protein